MPINYSDPQIRNEHISATVNGFALQEYKIKRHLNNVSSSAWKESYFQETSTELTATGTALTASRDDITINLESVVQNRVLGSQIGSQSLPASNSSLVNSALKYLGYNWDCTMLVEQALRDLGYSIGDVGPTGIS